MFREHGAAEQGQSTKGGTEENKEEKRQEGTQKKASESQVVHYMLCCNTGICAPTDLVLAAAALKQPESSWTGTVPAVSLCETHA